MNNKFQHVTGKIDVILNMPSHIFLGTLRGNDILKRDNDLYKFAFISVS